MTNNELAATLTSANFAAQVFRPIGTRGSVVRVTVATIERAAELIAFLTALPVHVKASTTGTLGTYHLRIY